jgi:hypothetical protein
MRIIATFSEDLDHLFTLLPARADSTEGNKSRYFIQLICAVIRIVAKGVKRGKSFEAK